MARLPPAFALFPLAFAFPAADVAVRFGEAFALRVPADRFADAFDAAFRTPRFAPPCFAVRFGAAFVAPRFAGACFVVRVDVAVDAACRVADFADVFAAGFLTFGSGDIASAAGSGAGDEGAGMDDGQFLLARGSKRCRLRLCACFCLCRS